MEEVTLSDIHSELKQLNKRIVHLERVLIPEIEATKQDRADYEQAMAEHQSGKTVNFRNLKD